MLISTENSVRRGSLLFTFTDILGIHNANQMCICEHSMPADSLRRMVLPEDLHYKKNFYSNILYIFIGSESQIYATKVGFN